MIIFNRFFIFLVLGLVGCAHGTDGTKPNRYPTASKNRWGSVGRRCQRAGPIGLPRTKNQLISQGSNSIPSLRTLPPSVLVSHRTKRAPVEHLNAFLVKHALQASHMGIFQSAAPRCLAIALVRRNLSNQTSLPFNLASKSPTPFRLRTDRPVQNPVLFIQHPNGRIDQKPLTPVEGGINFELRGTDWPKGHYIVEVLGQVEANSPELLFWWR